MIKENDYVFVKMCFTDLCGTWYNISLVADQISQELLSEGISFDGSSVPGYTEINNSDMLLMPDVSSAFTDVNDSRVLVVICDAINPDTMQPHTHDSRVIAQKAEEYLLSTGIADQAFFGPEPEFFIFDSVEYQVSRKCSFFNIDDKFGGGTGEHSYRVPANRSYLTTSPVDGLEDIRNDIVVELSKAGLCPTLHHHEVATCQCELGLMYSNLTQAADNVQKYKYIVRNVANQHGKTATFMPKPLFGENGSGMHVHQSLAQNKRNLFAGNGYQGLSETCMHYMGGLIKHGRALAAFTNSLTNSYKRLVPGYEAPVHLLYSSRNRSVAIRIPCAQSEGAKRIEARFPDPGANSYLAFAAMLAAGIDGIKNKIHPGNPVETNLFNHEHSKDYKHNMMPRSLAQSLDCLNNDRSFLTDPGIFTDSFIDQYIKIKKSDIDQVNTAPHPKEFELYYEI